jgi:putative transposase
MSQPRCGTRKIHKMMKNEHIFVGRDRLFSILKESNWLVKPKKSYKRTTNSSHHFRKHKNLIKNKTVDRPERVFVSDLTYIKTLEGFSYLALITDKYSRKIVGYDICNSLAVEGSLRALKMSLKNVKKSTKLIHHSDRGIQYCCYLYTNYLKKKGIKISMTEDNHVYENALAERVNGILKQEFNLDQSFVSRKSAKKAVKSAIEIYNSKRLHFSLGLKTPNEVHNAA